MFGATETNLPPGKFGPDGAKGQIQASESMSLADKKEPSLLVLAVC